MLFSSATGYALRALASLPNNGSFRLAKVLSEELQLPGPYLAKILQSLAQAGILESVRGPRGGFRLAKPPERIKIGEVVAVLEGPEALKGCIMGFPHCGPENPCPLHPIWSAMKSQIDVSLAQATLRDLQMLPSKRLATIVSPTG